MAILQVDFLKPKVVVWLLLLVYCIFIRSSSLRYKPRGFYLRLPRHFRSIVNRFFLSLCICVAKMNK